MSKLIKIQLTTEQVVALNPLLEEVIAAKNAGATGVVIGQTGENLETWSTVTFAFIESERAAEIIRVVSPKLYERYCELGLIPTVEFPE